jgi:hypothetical protein
MNPKSSQDGTQARTATHEAVAPCALAPEVRALGFTMAVVEQAGPDVPTLDLLAYAIDSDGLVPLDPGQAMARWIEDDAVLLRAAWHSGGLDGVQLDRYLHRIQRAAAATAELLRRCAVARERAAGGAAVDQDCLRTQRSVAPAAPVRLVPPQGSTG